MSNPYNNSYPAPPSSMPHVVHVPVAAKSVAVAYILWFFLGSLGAHKFYLGQTGWGVAYIGLLILIIPTAGLSLIALGLGVLVDLFLIPSRVQLVNLRNAY
jgi:TM2 domain-containing membrane protein YozV